MVKGRTGKVHMSSTVCGKFSVTGLRADSRLTTKFRRDDDRCGRRLVIRAVEWGNDDMRGGSGVGTKDSSRGDGRRSEDMPQFREGTAHGWELLLYGRAWILPTHIRKQDRRGRGGEIKAGQERVKKEGSGFIGKKKLSNG